MWPRQLFLFLLLYLAEGLETGREDIIQPYYSLFSSGYCNIDKSPWAITTAEEASRGLNALSITHGSVRYGTMASAPYGTWRGTSNYVLNMVGSGECHARKKCLCWVGPVCVNIVGNKMNPYECRCGTSTCDMNSYCVSEMNHCSAVPITACASPVVESENGVCACGRAKCSSGLYCHSESSTCSHVPAVYFKKWYGQCTDRIRSYTVTDSSNCLNANAMLHKGTWRTDRRHINVVPFSDEATGCLLHDDQMNNGQELWLNEHVSNRNCTASSRCICWSGTTCVHTEGYVKNEHSCRCGTTICSATAPYCLRTSGKCYKSPKCVVSNGTLANSATCSCSSRTCTADTGLFCLAPMGTCSAVSISACVSQNGTQLNAQSCGCGSHICPSGNYCDLSESKGSGQCSADGSWFVFKSTGKCTELHKGRFVRSKSECLAGGRKVSGGDTVLEGAYAPLGCYWGNDGLYDGLYLNKVNYGFQCNPRQRCICKQGY